MATAIPLQAYATRQVHLLYVRVWVQRTFDSSGLMVETIDPGNLPQGLYETRLFVGKKTLRSRFLKVE